MDRMKKSLFLLMLCFCCLLPGGCGKDDAPISPEGVEDMNGTKEYYDIMVENTAFPELESTGQALYFLGMQFYQGEAVQLWGRLTFNEAGVGNGGEIFQYKMDGSQETVANVPSDYLVSFTNGFQDSEGNIYFWGKKRQSLEEPNPVVILDSSGEELYRTDTDGKDGFTVYNVCQTLDGSVYWRILDNGDMTTKLAKSRPGALPEEMWDMRQWYGGGDISFYGPKSEL